jgi:hypothetical protein
MFGLSIIAWRWILYGLLAATIAGTAAWVVHTWDTGRAAVVEVKAIQHTSAVQTKAVAKADKAAAATEAKAQAAIAVQTRVIHERIPTYVTVRTPCIPWSVVRVHDAAVLGVDPSTLSLPAGQSNDACSDVAPAAFLGTLTDNYAAARANAQQLDDLIADASAREKAVEPSGVVAR